MIVRLQNETQQRIFLDTEDQDKRVDETPSLYHILWQRKRQESRMVDRNYDSEENLQTSPFNILRAFTNFMKKKYDTIPVEKNSIYCMLRRTNKTFPL